MNPEKGAVTGALFCVWPLLWLLLAGSLPASLRAECAPDGISETAQVRYVHDGDTLWLQDGRKLRLIGIDTPELKRSDRPAQPYAEQARDALRTLLADSDNRVALAYGPDRLDRYDRTLAHLYLPDGRSVQAELLKAGLASAFTTPPNDRRSTCYRQMEARAIEGQKGIWSLPRYRVKTLYQLEKGASGFHRIEGVVSRVHFGKKAAWIEMGQKGGRWLRLRIDNRDLPHFDLHALKTLEGRTLRVRGWLHTNRSHMFMALRHRDAIDIRKSAD